MKHRGLFIGLVLAGLAFIGWGAALQGMSIWKYILLSGGGALFGTSVATLLSGLLQRDLFSDVTSLLADRLEPGLFSKDTKIRGHRVKYHRYHVTKIEGTFVWRYTEVDFSTSFSVGRLTCTIREIGRDGTEHLYDVAAGFADARFLLFSKPQEGDEQTLVEIYPLFGKKFLGHHCGLSIVESWDADNLICACIMTRESIGGWEKMGTVESRVAKLLGEVWHEGLANRNVLLPMVSEPSRLPNPTSTVCI